MTTERKEFPIEVILSLTTEILLVERGFGQVQECGSFVVGHSLFTHEFADMALWKHIRDSLYAQHPSLAEAETFAPPVPTGVGGADAASDTKEYVRAYVARARAKFGETLTIQRWQVPRGESPVESLHRLAPQALPIVICAEEKLATEEIRVTVVKQRPDDGESS